MSKISVQEQRKERILWINGLRGIGCLCIFFHHFFLKYYPATFFGKDAESRMLFGLDAMLADFPFFFLLNGNFWVCIYLFISGMVMVHKNVENAEAGKGKYFIAAFFKRYLTLILPIFLAEAAVFFGNQRFPDKIIPDIGYSVSIFHYLKSSIWSVMFACDRSILGILWTMQAIFLGGMLILLIRLAFSRKINQFIAMAVCMILFLHMPGDYWYFAPVMAGGMFWLLHKYIEFLPGMRVFGWIFFVAGCFLAAYPSGVSADGIYGILPDSHFGPFTYHFCGAAFLVSGISVLPLVQNVFSMKATGLLGKISYPFYVFHGVAIKMTNLFYDELTGVIHSYSMTVLILASGSIAICFMVAVFYSCIVEPLWRKAVGKIC